MITNRKRNLSRFSMNKLLSLMPLPCESCRRHSRGQKDVGLRNSLCLRRPFLTSTRAKQGSKSISCDCARHPGSAHAQLTSKILDIRLCVGNVFDSTLRTSNQAEEAPASRPIDFPNHATRYQKHTHLPLCSPGLPNATHREMQERRLETWEMKGI